MGSNAGADGAAAFSPSVAAVAGGPDSDDARMDSARFRAHVDALEALADVVCSVVCTVAACSVAACSVACLAESSGFCSATPSSLALAGGDGPGVAGAATPTDAASVSPPFPPPASASASCTLAASAPSAFALAAATATASASASLAASTTPGEVSVIHAAEKRTGGSTSVLSSFSSPPSPNSPRRPSVARSLAAQRSAISAGIAPIVSS